MRTRLAIAAATVVIGLSIAAIRPADLWRLVLEERESEGPRKALPPPHFTVDRLKVLALLRDREFDALTQLIESSQKRFEDDFGAEADLALAVVSFHTADPALTPVLDAWVAAQPRSFAPLLARAKHFEAVAFARRGAKLAEETSEEQFQGMRTYLAKAVRDAKAALALHPKLSEAYHVLMSSAMAFGDQETCRRLADEALAMAPYTLRVRVSYLHCQLPRWGGSYEAMDAFARDAQRFADRNPRLTVLMGFVDWDKGKIQRKALQFDEAVRSFTRALRFGDYWEFYEDRGDAYYRMHSYRQAVADLDRALELWPQEPATLGDRALALEGMELTKPAIDDVEMLLRVDPASEADPNFRERQAAIAVRDGYDLAKAGRLDEAIRRYTWADWFASGKSDALYWRGRAEIERNDRDAAFADFEEMIRRNPRHFDSYANLRWLLSEKGDWDAIIQRWDAFLALEPLNGDAYLERGGAYHRKGDEEAALADARKACDLGNGKGCEIVACRTGKGCGRQ
jgi:tetratricopeptide (TPR) repeat protein